MLETNDISLEFMRRVMAGQSPMDLKSWVVNALDGRTEEEEAGWQIRTAADALKAHAPLEYLVDQLLPAPCLAIVYGGPGSLKSMILADLAVCVASGTRWLEQLESDRVQPGVSLETKQAPVLWIDFDNGARRTDIRIGAMLRGRLLPETTPIHYVSMPTPHLDASKLSHIESLGRLIRGNGYRMVIIDNLGLITGDVEENSADMANVMGHLRRLSEDTQAAIVLIHHQRKSAANGDANGIRKGETLRGHSSIEASLDLALLIERKQGEDVIAMIPTKVRDYLAFELIGARFTYEHADETHDLYSARFFSQAAASKEEMATRQLRATILDICRATPGIQQVPLVAEVRDRMAVLADVRMPGVNKVRGTLKAMVDDGKLTVSGKAGAYQYWAER